MPVSTQVFSVTGMTCGHCVAAVTAEVEKIPGVTDVTVDLGEPSAVTVTSAEPVPVDAVRAAVDEAGYDLME